MSRLFLQRLVSSVGVLGAVLVIGGFFLPCRITTYPTHPVWNTTDSFWEMFVNTVTSPSAPLDLPTGLEIGSFSLAILIPLGISLTALLGKRKRVFFRFSLAFAMLGFMEVLIVSFWLFGLTFARVVEIRTAGPGLRLMLSGFLISIGRSIAENVFLKPHATVIESPAGLLERRPRE